MMCEGGVGRSRKVPRLTTASDIYARMRLSTAVFPTGIDSLDTTILRGGVLSGEITELCGPSASGKTQICFNLMAHTAIVLKQHVAYVDTNCSFSRRRLRCIMQGHGVHDDQELSVALSRISVLPCFDLLQLFAILECGDPQPLIVIDSVLALLLPVLAGPRMDGLGLLNRVAVHLKHLATDGNKAIVVTNGVARWREDEPPQPSLGRCWSYVANVRLVLSGPEGDGTRLATVDVAKTVGRGRRATFRLTTAGVE